MNSILLITVLLVGIGAWILVLRISMPQSANKCGYRICGFYDNMSSNDIDQHLCRHPSVTNELFENQRTGTDPCKYSSEFLGSIPHDHLIFMKKKKKESLTLAIAGIVTVLVALTPHIVKEFQEDKTRPESNSGIMTNYTLISIPESDSTGLFTKDKKQEVRTIERQ